MATSIQAVPPSSHPSQPSRKKIPWVSSIPLPPPQQPLMRIPFLVQLPVQYRFPQLTPITSPRIYHALLLAMPKERD